MPKNNLFKKLTSELGNLIPSHLSTLKSDFEKNCHGILLSTFNKLDLVTREEFDTQTKVLLRTRKKMEELESQLKELDALLKHKHHKSK